MTEAQAQIQQFLQQCRAEREQTATKLREVEILAQQSLTEVERLASRNADLESRLRATGHERVRAKIDAGGEFQNWLLDLRADGEEEVALEEKNG